ncbi:hypothetical protein DHEL01_v211283 [Diaporthe helianthi]|uniref:SnoaL-like domain-containing protein n=1 Tax=Diaporthe helianthi TaxID=158607 RepID=A0A2P5HJD3_DIAHE|nr:hypothetical protein DHEL01_v211283 [Diaporthe helianthi]
MDSLREVIQGTITAFVENNTAAVKNKNVSLLSSQLSDNCVKEYRPLSFVRKYPQFFKSQVTNAEYEAQMSMELNTMTDVKQNVTRTVIDAHQRVANVWIDKTVYTVDGSESSVEVIYDLEFTQDGKQITKYIEFVDTFKAVQVLEQMLSNAGGN